MLLEWLVRADACKHFCHQIKQMSLNMNTTQKMSF